MGLTHARDKTPAREPHAPTQHGWCCSHTKRSKHAMWHFISTARLLCGSWQWWHHVINSCMSADRGPGAPSLSRWAASVLRSASSSRRHFLTDIQPQFNVTSMWSDTYIIWDPPKKEDASLCPQLFSKCAVLPVLCHVAQKNQLMEHGNGFLISRHFTV